ncbi:ABC transporter permease [Methanohalophilus portucalensis]|uniref:ABC transporter n=2 Tax=Methanohalophilus portucalensis TaxID=39664 RepID=A0A1L9C1P1_9EURY|nr:ABC transporter permease [Methanohalophilus portucalensis]ATU09129.1 ABC transporter permease [Methanohalophilus portucalensis]OJH48432.1 ABC transporter [Methanohalophilus portucalensis FDF-1]RNI08554.1 ABC transporter permease [Methanohalophilus portucalensis FDF-1]SMH44866.1 lipooligosaccharide transport system permease protein [Methanohalophilus portucalensis FDF-1]
MMSYFALPDITPRVLKVWMRNRDVFMTTLTVNFLPPLVEPILYLFALGFGLGNYINEIEGVPYTKFIAPALISVSMMFAGFYECTFGSYVRMYYQKTFDAIIATPLNIDEVIAGELLWGATRGVINASIILPILSIFGLAVYPHSLLVIPFAFLAGLMFSCIAMCFTAITPNINSLTYPSILLITPMFLFSGTFFPLSLLPETVQYIALAILPLAHIVIVVRSLMGGIIEASLLLNIAWMLGATLLVFLLSINLMKKRLIV